MVKTNKFLGSVLLIAGTAIGAGMLGLPVMSGFAGFFPTLVFLFFLWIYMLTTAFLYLEVNLAFPGNINLITMASKTLGVLGKVVAWIVYLLLLYSLTTAYMASSAPLFQEGIKALTGYILPRWMAPLPLLVFFGSVTYLGARPADYINRILMTGLILAYFILAIFLPPHTDFNLLKHADIKATFLAFPLIITSFGFHVIIPTLTSYMRHNVKKLKWSLIIGSFIPFLIYVLWEFLVLGTVKLTGNNSLSQMYVEGQSSSVPLIDVLMNVINKPWIARAANLFSFFAIITSFIGVTLSLADFLTDGFKIKRNKKGRIVACILTFAPPLIFFYGFQRVFIQALQYAGIFVGILLCILPALMVWKLPIKGFYKTIWGRILLVVIILIAVLIIGLDIAEETGMLRKLVEGYLN